ncbi:Protein STE50 [Pseudocercospora fuligena]|uniref:Protein STE50 n=1 Tax=Pseudocercospora fuligena TaxID=685502 RepID=A0A8H6VN83_9PEZI|nr:Protein STE50 [Pseudocercospora fuligena]
MHQAAFLPPEPAYAANPTGKGSWIARVSQRASHIPANREILAANTKSAAATTTTTASFASPLKTALSLQTAIESTGFASSLEESLSAVQERAYFQSAPASPVRASSDFPRDTNLDSRAPTPVSRLPHVANQQLLSRPSTAVQVDKPLPESPGATIYPESGGAMDKYARQAGDTTYDSDAEADDEFERSVFTSPNIPHDYDDHSDHPSDSEDDHSVVDGEDTPTTQGWADRDGRSPTGKITQWTEEEVADYIAALSPTLKQYGQRFVEEGVSGEALIALNHDELKELGVTSVGHRLTILKAVYEQKMRAGVKIEEGDYVPLSAEGEKGEMTATQDDIARIIDSLRLRDQRIVQAEQQLRIIQADLDRTIEENRKLREETLPIMRLVKNQNTPLPDPAGGTIPSPREIDPSGKQGDNKGSSLSRKFSTKKLFLKSDSSKQPSPTHPPQSHTPQPREVRDDGGAHLEASAAAMAASTHLTASMTAQTSPNSVHGQQLSPTSPAYSTTGPPTGGSYGHVPGSAAARSFPTQNQRQHNHDHDTQYANHHYSQASTVVQDQPSARLREQDRSRRQAPTPSPREDETPNAGRDRDNPQVEIFKSFRVSIDDPCRVVLPVALKRYNITDDWRQYALYIVHGDQERCLGLEEKPLLLFKQLDKEGRKPMFMLRRHASPQEGWSGAAGGGIPTQETNKSQIPGGVL